ncbi:MAG: hypothetical protein ABF752_12770, partial [Acetobacter fabarum]|uniref:hypothetical protein n=1 Tax=Acetobacter fabarum TaxID=483199 RepID=UPI0039E91637
PSPTFLNEPMIIVLSPGLYRAATTVASMAIVSPETTGGAPAVRPKQREGRRHGTFLFRAE